MWLILIKDYLKYINLMIIGFFEIYYPQFPFNLNLWASVMFSRSFRKKPPAKYHCQICLRLQRREPITINVT